MLYKVAVYSIEAIELSAGKTTKLYQSGQQNLYVLNLDKHHQTLQYPDVTVAYQSLIKSLSWWNGPNPDVIGTNTNRNPTKK